MQQQMQVMLDLQDEMNTKVHPNWRSQNFEWYRAIWIECAEMLDHYGWKWWKKQTADIEQVKLELIDIWHFGLSILLSKKTTADDLCDSVIRANDNCEGLASFALELEKFVLNTLNSRDFDLHGFVRVMRTIDLEFEELYRGYVGKNVLNFFRQDNGYQSGTYQKVWAGREDNEHLVELRDRLDVGTEDFRHQLYRQLQIRYTEFLEER